MALVLGSKKTNYPYAVARIQAKRGHLIPRQDYDKLVRMDLSEITRFIEESSYKAEVDELASRFSGLDLLESALVVNQERVHQSVRRMLAGEGGDMVDRFLARFVVADIKSVLRGKNAGATKDELVRELLLEDLDAYNMFLPLLSEDIQGVGQVVDALERQPSPVARQWARVLRTVPQDAPLSAYEDALDKAYFARLLESTKAFSQKGGDVLRKFVRREIDARNLQNATRWAANKQDGDFSPFVIPGGKDFAVGDIMTIAGSGTLAAAVDAIEGHKVAERLKDALAEAKETDRVGPFILGLRRWLHGELDRIAHQHPLSIVPVLNFLIHKEQEVANLRALARGKAGGLSETRLQELIV